MKPEEPRLRTYRDHGFNQGSPAQRGGWNKNDKNEVIRTPRRNGGYGNVNWNARKPNIRNQWSGRIPHWENINRPYHGRQLEYNSPIPTYNWYEPLRQEYVRDRSLEPFLCRRDHHLSQKVYGRREGIRRSPTRVEAEGQGQRIKSSHGQ